MRIVTRPDFDGIVCAVVIKEVEDITEPILWIEPSDVQGGIANIRKGDIIANLPYDKRCSLWFDHHISNKPEADVPGAFDVAPSAAGVAYKYYKTSLEKNYDELIRETDKIDAALLSIDEVKFPEKYSYILLSMTISNRGDGDEKYWNMLVDLLGKQGIDEIMAEPEVKKRCLAVVSENTNYKGFLEKHTCVEGHMAITDFRSLDNVPSGNRFMVYSLFPEACVSMKIRFDEKDKEKVILSVGHNIFNKSCLVNVGQMLSKYGGGGHRGAGGCSFPAGRAVEYIAEIKQILTRNVAD